MKNVDVSVLIPAHNAEWCLEDCIKSIADQTRKPTEVLIGVDNCTKTLVLANKIQMKYARKRSIRDKLFIKVYEFPEQTYPYIVRNTLACLAQGGILCFFDADDLMYPSHVEVMAGGVKRGVFVAAAAEITENNLPKTKWENAHGVISISKMDFLSLGGFEPWVCGADSEARQRFVKLGMKCLVPRDPTMLVRKHPEGLTRKKETGYGSAIRTKYAHEIKRRGDEKDFHPIAMTCGKCVEWYGGESGVYPADVESNKAVELPDTVKITAKPAEIKHTEQLTAEPVVEVKQQDPNKCPHCGTSVPRGRERPFMCGRCYGPVV